MRQLKITQTTTDRNDKAVGAYLTDIGRLPTLSIDEEIELARQIRQGGRQAEVAKEKLVKGNLRFVISVAKQYQGKGLPLADLINEGNIGLIKCAERFNDERGFKFISYAVWWIRQSIIEAISNQGRTVRLPMNNATLLNKYWKMYDEYLQECQRKPTAEEFAEVAGIDTAKAADIINAASKASSLDDTVGDDSETKTSDILAGDSCTDGDLDRESLHIEIINAMEKVLSKKEMAIMCCHYGIGVPQMSADEMSLKFDLSSERLRQIREKCILRLGESPARKLLKMYL